MKITEKFMGFQILLLQFREALYVIPRRSWQDHKKDICMICMVP